MPAGHNQIASVFRFSYPSDDMIGGSQPSGTVLYTGMLVRIEPLSPTTALLEQGVETTKLFETTISSRAVGIDENDEIVVTYPLDSPYYNKKFRIISVRHSSLRPNDPRSQTLLVLKRYEDAHAYQYG